MTAASSEGRRLRVPMAEIHCHLEGAAPPWLARAKAEKYGETIDDLLAADGAYFRWTDFAEFLAVYDRVVTLFRTPEDFADLAYHHFTALAGEGAIYAEVFIAPDTASLAGLSYRDYLGGIVAGLERARTETGIDGRLIPCAVRQNRPESALRAVREVLDNPHPLVTGFGLAGDERRFEPRDFAAAFELAREAGLGLTAHAGEVCGAASVRATLDALPVTRIGHGVHAIEDADLVARIVAEEIVLEVCPGSNVALGLYADRASHPLAALRDAGVRVTINSDDPPFFGTSLAAEYERTADALGWGEGDLAAATRAALAAAFVDEETRSRLLAALDAHQGAG